MKLTVESAYGNFKIDASVEVEVSVDPVKQPTSLKLLKLGLASELYRVGNSAVDKRFAPKREGKDGKRVPVLTAWKDEKGVEHPAFKRESVAYGEDNAGYVRDSISVALTVAGYAVIEVKVSEKVRGDEAAPMKRATEMYEKSEAGGKLDALAMLIGYEEETGDKGKMVAAIHAWMNPKK